MSWVSFKREEEGEEIVRNSTLSLIEREAKEQLKRQKERTLKDQSRKEEEAKEEARIEEEKKMSEDEIVNIRSRLRKLREPIKLFGESPFQAYQRLWAIEQDDTAGIVEGQETFDAKKGELKKNIFQQSLIDKLANKKAIDLEIGGEAAEEVIGLRTTKNGSYLDFKKFEKECRGVGRKEKCMLILKWIK